ncbi:MAG TPA: MarR family transcriptional regulator, partial [Arthrobacter sp.]|nr:MarR family transcriptional regulator [Arthrobacter sp.]
NTEVFGQSGFGQDDVNQLIRILGDFRRGAGDFAG